MALNPLVVLREDGVFDGVFRLHGIEWLEIEFGRFSESFWSQLCHA
jgi:hypothetical protein